MSFPLWFPYVSPGNETPYIGPVWSMLALQYQVGAELKALRSPRDTGRMVRDWSRFARYRPLLDQAILLWNPIHHVIRGYRDRHPDRSFVPHEDLARDPINGFRTLYGNLSLPFGESVEAFLTGHSERSESDAGISPFPVRPNSQATVSVWRTRLTVVQIDRVRAAVEPIARDFLSEPEWEGTLRSRAE